jgi:hypothetical protein
LPSGSNFQTRRLAAFWARSLGEVFLQGRPGGFALVGLGADGFQQPVRGRALDLGKGLVVSGMPMESGHTWIFDYVPYRLGRSSRFVIRLRVYVLVSYRTKKSLFIGPFSSIGNA